MRTSIPIKLHPSTPLIALAVIIYTTVMTVHSMYAATKQTIPLHGLKTEVQRVKLNLPNKSILENENLELTSFYQTINIKSNTIKTHKVLAIKITKVDPREPSGQLLFLSKKVGSEKLRYDFPVYIEQTKSVYLINTLSIAKGLVWFNPLMITQGKLTKPILMAKILKDPLFTSTISAELDYLIINKPEEIGGDFQGERGKRLTMLVTTAIKNNLEQKIPGTKPLTNYYDCGNSKTCLSEKADKCTLAKGEISDGGETVEHFINGLKNKLCLYYSKILTSNVGYTGLEINCQLSTKILSQSFAAGLNPDTLLSSCSGSYIDYMKKYYKP